MEDPVLLGLMDEEIKTDGVETSWETNKVGGKPDFMDCKNIPTCKVCNCSLVHVCQIYCPLGNSEYHRTLYIFACTEKKCWNNRNSWAVIRSQIMVFRSDTTNYNIEDQHHQDITPQADKGCQEKLFENDDWGMEADDWGDEDIGEDKQVENEQLIAMVTDRTGFASQDGQYPDNDKVQHETESAKISELNVKTSQMFIRNKFEGDDDNGTSEERNSLENDCSEVCIAEDIDLNTQNSDIGTYLNNTGDGKVATKSDHMQECGVEKENTSKTSENDQTVSGSCNFMPYYVNVFEEPDATAFEDTLKHEKKLLKEYAKKERVDVSSLMDKSNFSGGEGENYEKSSIKHGDDTFYKFTKRVGRCPQQILRYQHNGKPLLMKRLQTTVSPCENCGKQREFELQLMPALVNVLKGQNSAQSKDNLLEFGTVLVYTCSQSCWRESKQMSEYVIVQSDPDQHLFKT